MIRYSIETLYHFQCFICNQWWSIGDWDMKSTLRCPHCGYHGIVQPIEPRGEI